MTTKLLLTFCLLTLTLSLWAQSGAVKGTITTPDNKPAAAASVRLKGTKKTTLTNNEGAFAIAPLAPATYTLEVTSVGYQPLEKEVTVLAGGPTDTPASWKGTALPPTLPVPTTLTKRR